jgi:hypothetical protein
MPDITAAFGSRFRRPGVGNPEESLGVLNHLRPGPAAEPEMPTPGTQLGPGVTQIGQLDGDAFWGDSAASQVGRARYFNDADQDMAVSNLMRLTGAQRQIGRDNQAEADFDLANNAPNRARLQNDVGDINSERAAGRAFLPNASQVYTRGRADTRQDNYSRYQLPAEIRSDAELGAAELGRQGQEARANATLGAANAKAGDPNRELIIGGLMKAAQEQIVSGKGVNPQELAQIVNVLRQLTGGR